MKLTTSTRTITPDSITRKWHLIDANGQILGRMASSIATILKGKHRAEYTPNMDMGDFVIVINAKKIKTTGSKLNNKIYYKHTGYIGNLKSINLADLLEKDACLVIKKAIKGMMPRTPLGRAMMKKLKIYHDENHPHEAQNPEILTLS